jgi:hypothetical protein
LQSTPQDLGLTQASFDFLTAHNQVFLRRSVPVLSSQRSLVGHEAI